MQRRSRGPPRLTLHRPGISCPCMYGRILVAVDSSEASFSALREARTLATASAAELVILHVAPGFAQNTVVSADYAETLPRLAEYQQENRSEIERQVAEVLQGPAPVSFVAGDPAATIVAQAKALSANLIVVGAHQRSRLERLLLGSVAEAVLRSAACPVLVSRESPRTGRVLVATDVSEASMAALALAVVEARQRKARLTVVHVMDSREDTLSAGASGLIGMSPALPPPELQADVRDALTKTLTGALERFGGEGDVLLLDGKPAAAIVEAAETGNAELLVVGTQGRSGLSRLALGSVAEAVARNSPCSVLVAR